jgi:hypothetical protein
MKKTIKYLVIASFPTLLISSCSFPTAEEEMQSEWVKFDPIVKTRIYELIRNKDCDGLQAQFNITADNMDRLFDAGNIRNGSRNSKLLGFIDEKMEELGCYN